MKPRPGCWRGMPRCGTSFGPTRATRGRPQLWHLLLAVPAKAGAPYIALNIVSAALAWCGAALLLFKSPFPKVLRVLLPLGFFFFYQYGIVSRSYALFIPLLWVVAVVYPGRFAHPWRYVLALILLSQVSLHGSLIAGALISIFVAKRGGASAGPWRGWRRWSSPSR